MIDPTLKRPFKTRQGRKVDTAGPTSGFLRWWQSHPTARLIALAVAVIAGAGSLALTAAGVWQTQAALEEDRDVRRQDSAVRYATLMAEISKISRDAALARPLAFQARLAAGAAVYAIARHLADEGLPIANVTLTNMEFPPNADLSGMVFVNVFLHDVQIDFWSESGTHTAFVNSYLGRDTILRYQRPDDTRTTADRSYLLFIESTLNDVTILSEPNLVSLAWDSEIEAVEIRHPFQRYDREADRRPLRLMVVDGTWVEDTVPLTAVCHKPLDEDLIGLALMEAYLNAAALSPAPRITSMGSPYGRSQLETPPGYHPSESLAPCADPLRQSPNPPVLR